ncbi:MAG: eL32 family ribosomal protein [Candidatus Micrarchaeaceae archaeon]
MVLKKKSHPTFNVPNYGAKNRKRVKPRWRKQRGIDNKKRIKKAFMGAEPTIGYRNPESLRHTRSDGTIAILVHSRKELIDIIEDPDINNFSITIASSVSKRKSSEIAAIAGQNGIKVTNPPKKEQAQEVAKQQEGAKK